MKWVAGHPILPGGGAATPRPSGGGQTTLPLSFFFFLRFKFNMVKTVHLTLVNGNYQKFDDKEFIFIFTDSGSKFSKKKKFKEFLILES